MSDPTTFQLLTFQISTIYLKSKTMLHQIRFIFVHSTLHQGGGLLSFYRGTGKKSFMRCITRNNSSKKDECKNQITRMPFSAKTFLINNSVASYETMWCGLSKDMASPISYSKTDFLIYTFPLLLLNSQTFLRSSLNLMTFPGFAVLYHVTSIQVVNISHGFKQSTPLCKNCDKNRWTIKLFIEPNTNVMQSYSESFRICTTITRVQFKDFYFTHDRTTSTWQALNYPSDTALASVAQRG